MACLFSFSLACKHGRRPPRRGEKHRKRLEKQLEEKLARKTARGEKKKTVGRNQTNHLLLALSDEFLDLGLSLARNLRDLSALGLFRGIKIEEREAKLRGMRGCFFFDTHLADAQLGGADARRATSALARTPGTTLDRLDLSPCTSTRGKKSR